MIGHVGERQELASRRRQPFMRVARRCALRNLKSSDREHMSQPGGSGGRPPGLKAATAVASRSPGATAVTPPDIATSATKKPARTAIVRRRERVERPGSIIRLIVRTLSAPGPSPRPIDAAAHGQPSPSRQLAKQGARGAALPTLPLELAGPHRDRRRHAERELGEVSAKGLSAAYSRSFASRSHHIGCGETSPAFTRRQ